MDRIRRNRPIDGIVGPAILFGDVDGDGTTQTEQLLGIVDNDGPGAWSILNNNPEISAGDTARYVINLAGDFGVDESAILNLLFVQNESIPLDQDDFEEAIRNAINGRPELQCTLNADPAGPLQLIYTSPSDGSSLAPIVIELPTSSGGVPQVDSDVRDPCFLTADRFGLPATRNIERPDRSHNHRW
ncbi:MAG: hypothetical protein R3C05_21245 [Pirellulaceae bacterium]